jgi:hypothetical protein
MLKHLTTVIAFSAIAFGISNLLAIPAFAAPADSTGSPAKLIFATQPTGTVVGSVIPSFSVVAADANNQVVTSNSPVVTLTISKNPGGGVLNGTTTMSGAGGIAQFSDLSISGKNGSYILTASSPGLTAAVSSSFNVMLPQLTCVLQSTQVGIGKSIAATITIPSPAGSAGLDIAIANGSPQYVGLASTSVHIASGTTSVPFTYSGLAAGTSMLSFTASGYAPTALPIKVPLSLAFLAQPTNTALGSAISMVNVVAMDAPGHVATGYTYSVTLAIGTNAGAGVLGGTKTVVAGANGANFTDLSIGSRGAGYTLIASSAGLASIVSTPFNVLAPIAATVTSSPINAGASSTGTLTLGTAATGTGVDVAISNSSTQSVSVGASIVHFPAGQTTGTFTYKALAVGTSTLSFAASGYNGTTTTVVVKSPATKLAFVTQPSSTTRDSVIPAFSVAAVDASNQVVTGTSYPVTITFSKNPGGGVLSGDTTISTGSGNANFSNLSISSGGSGYILTASSPGLTSAVSSSFNVTLPSLTCVLQNTTVGMGKSMTASITIPSAAGSSGVDVTITNGSPQYLSLGASTLHIAAGATSASFTYSGLTAGSSLLTFTAPGYSPTALPIKVPLSLAFVVQPSSTTKGSAIPSFSVVAIDAPGHIATLSTPYPVALAICTNPGGGVLSGTTTVNGGSGAAVFSNLSLNQYGSGYVLAASSTGFAPASSASFNILPTISATVANTSVATGSTLTGTLTLAMAAGSTGLDVAIGNSGSQYLNLSSQSVHFAAGQSAATFTYSGMAVGTSTLTFAAAGYLGTSTTISVTAGTSGKLVFKTQPGNTSVSTSLVSASVMAVDLNGVPVTASYPVTLSIGTNPSGALLNGTTTLNGSATPASFTNLAIAQAGVGYTLVASSPGYTSAISSPFTVAAVPMSLSLANASIYAGSVWNGIATLSWAPSDKAVDVALSSTNSTVMTVSPAVLHFAAGQTTAAFTYSGMAVGSSTVSLSSPNYVNASANVAISIAPGGPIPTSYFGLQVLRLANLNTSLTYGSTRTWDVYPLDWSDSNPSAGVYLFTSLDTFMLQNQVRNSEMIYTLGRTPQWASSQPKTVGMYNPGECAPPTNMTDWDNYVRAIAYHAAGKIKYWEVWNEPNDPMYYCGDIPTMITMAQHASQIIKSIDPTALILSPGVTGTTGAAWLTSFLSQGGSQYVDVISYHGYWSGNAEDVTIPITRYRSVMQSTGTSSKPLWETEGSWGSGGAAPTSDHAVGFISKFFLLHWSNSVPKAMWYAYDGSALWGGLYDSVKGLSPAATAYTETQKWLVGATQTKPCSMDTSSIWTCSYMRSGYTSEAVWIANSAATFTVPPQFVQYRDLAGGVHQITSQTLTISDQPILLESGNQP